MSKQIIVEVSDFEYEWLEQQARSRGRSPEELISAAISEKVDLENALTLFSQHIKAREGYATTRHI